MVETRLGGCGEWPALSHTSPARGPRVDRSQTVLLPPPPEQTTRHSGRRCETPSRPAAARAPVETQLRPRQVSQVRGPMAPVMEVSAQRGEVTRVESDQTSVGADSRQDQGWEYRYSAPPRSSRPAATRPSCRGLPDRERGGLRG